VTASRAERRRRTSTAIADGARAALTGPIVRIPAVLVDLLALLAAFAIGSALAGLLGAANLGTALTFGTIAFAAVLVALLLTRER
jgi:hypothetical protein